MDGSEMRLRHLGLQVPYVVLEKLDVQGSASQRFWVGCTL